jgi:hypothetical protein
MLYGFLALFGGGMWLESNEPVRLPPTAAEIKQMARQG